MYVWHDVMHIVTERGVTIVANHTPVTLSDSQ